jgi:hypothetical protein
MCHVIEYSFSAILNKRNAFNRELLSTTNGVKAECVHSSGTLLDKITWDVQSHTLSDGIKKYKYTLEMDRSPQDPRFD